MLAVGGLSSLPGAILGAAIMILVPEYMRALAEYKMLLYGVLLILLMTFLPQGLAPTLERLLYRISNHEN
jgi:branched-chain amino acid transport system permease protein